MIGTIKISQLPLAEAITGNENLIVNQDGDTRLTTINDAVGIVTYVNASGISTVSQGLTGVPNISVSALNVSGVSTLGNVQVFSGIVTASSGIVTYYGDGSKLQNIISGVGIQSSGTFVGTGITTLNFIGAGNTFSVNGSTVNISIQGGGGGESYWVASSSGIHTTSNVGIGTTNPIQPLQVGVAGTNVFVVTDIGSVGIGTTNPTSKLQVAGDINLDDGGSFTTTLQTVTPTAARTISFPNATGTVALVAGSSGQLLYNASGANAGTSTITYDGTNVTLSGRFISSLNGALSATGIAGVPVAATGTWIAAGGTSTTTKPQVLIEPTGTTSTNWSTAGTGFGVNATSGFAGNLLDLQVNGTSKLSISAGGSLLVPSSATRFVSLSPTTSTLATVRYDDNGTIRSFSLVNKGTTTDGNGQGIGFESNSVLSAAIDASRQGGVDNTALVFSTRAGGAGSLTEAFRLTPARLATFGGTTSSFPALKRNSAVLETKLADDSAYAQHAASVFEAATAHTVATLPGTPAVGMVARVTDATAPAVGTTVAGGGAAAALCWYNGANWSVIGV